ncbi:MerR family transcriptional regulator [Marinisporobacter balticus]|uniref:DNA-binding transcriptional MerR regulator n=1 Tax=Marinisporobacter balticus TaxID=2018667 RepID=A0A4R2LK77_9FIRM|nr:MerR family transcriptional regulator [Marinisporobacter balticus]TCO79785.1 DNA-binding transcriptional MerR regulator [Marinisporobacter balticus]
MIDKEKNYSISEVSKITGYETHVLRYYESDFDLEIPRTTSNRRYYTYKEIDQFFYIKQLQEKGLTNKQIKLILESPELVVPANNEVAITASEQLSILEENTDSDVIKTLCMNINDTVNANVNYKLEETKNEIIACVTSILKEKENLETGDAMKKEKDILLCENARLKMKVKEKAYELAELKEKMNRLDHKKKGVFERIFSIKK